MRIIRLEIQGFKSFARPETFEFLGEGFTAIVGPNGCGKSNVIDAIRWVLGERSRKGLRMKDSTDVIFGGTTSRPAAKHSTVTITFDNADGQIASLGNEFSITRRLSSSGDSTYRINDEDCKLRDIQDLLKGTGIGPEGYSIMSQGKIDALLVSNPAERRKVFEEAAGISTYRAQKASSERKLEVVSQNLAILTQKINDAKSRLRNIKGAASRAFKFKEYSERLRVLRTQLSLKQFHRFSQERENLLLGINEVGRQEGQINKELAAVTMEFESLAKKLSQGEARVEELRNAYHDCDMQLGQGETRRAEARAKIEGLERASERAEADVVRLTEQIEALTKRRSELEETAAGSRTQLEESDGILAKLAAEETTLLNEGRSLEANIRALRDSHVEELHAKNATLNEKLRIEAEAKAAAQRRLRLDRRRTELNGELEALTQSEKGAQERFEADSAKWSELQDELKDVESKIGTYNTQLGELRAKRHKLELQLSACQSRIAHLEDLENMLEGIDQGSRELANDKKLRERFGIEGLIAEVMKVELGVAPALEAALGKLSNALVVDTAEHAFDAFDYLARKDGAAATIVIADHFNKVTYTPRFPSGTGILGPLVDEIDVPKGFETMAAALLGEWLLVADRDVARRILEKKNTPTDIKLVTPTGEIFHNGAISVPSSDRSGGVITQRSELERRRKEFKTLSDEADTLNEKIETLVGEVQTINTRTAELREEMHQANSVVVESRSELEHISRRITILKEELEVVESEHKEIADLADKDKQRLEEIAGEIETHDKEISRIEDEIDKLAEAHGTYDERRSSMHEKLTAQRVAVAEHRSRLGAIEQSASELDATVKNFTARIAEYRKEQETGTAEIKRLNDEIEDFDKGESSLHAKRDQMKTQSEEAASSLETLRASVEGLRGKERSLNQQMIELKDSVSQRRVDEEKLFMMMNNLRERLLNDYEVDLDGAYRDYNPEQDTLDEKEAAGEIEALTASVKRLGNVNLEAVDELESVETHYQNLSTQEQDLVRAKKALEDAIERIEGEARRRFVNTFETVRGHFQRLFRKMFGGGSADVILLNPEDVLESGIEVMAKPPGMEPKSLNLLSGGQRTMIAVALMFSLFESCPAPFALLDEVDAALDDANVERFCTILREFVGQAQFVVITHHKATMSHADRLYGVTMQEPGISKKVIVNLNDYDPVAEEKEAQANILARA